MEAKGREWSDIRPVNPINVQRGPEYSPACEDSEALGCVFMVCQEVKEIPCRNTSSQSGKDDVLKDNSRLSSEFDLLNHNSLALSLFLSRSPSVSRSLCFSLSNTHTHTHHISVYSKVVPKGVLCFWLEGSADWDEQTSLSPSLTCIFIRLPAVSTHDGRTDRERER